MLACWLCKILKTMKIKVEYWIEKSKFSDNVNILFKDAIICYKSGAFRASLLFSYLGFLTILKERIISANKPNLFSQGEWDNLIRKIQNEDTWEANIFDSTQQQEKTDPATRTRTKDPIFSINDNLRIQIKYWKDRRNDCAHYKDNRIENYHVEAFWAFIESNLSKITIEGGYNSILNKFRKHYDVTYTPPNKDVSPLLQEIESSVDKQDLTPFWKDVIRIIDSGYTFWPDLKCLNFIEKVFIITNVDIQQSLVDFLKTEDELLLSFLSSYPSRILVLSYSPPELRNFWKTKLFKASNVLDIYARMLINNLIPKAEIEEANEFIFDKISYYTESTETHLVLKENGFDKIVNKIAFDDDKFSGFMWVNSKADFFRDFFKMYPLTPKAVEKICVEFNKGNHSYWLAERLDKMFSENPDKKNEFKAITIEKGYTLPSHIKSLNN